MEGRLGRPVPAGLILVPGSISIEGEAEAISWKMTEDSHFVEPDKFLLNRFVRLGDISTSQIVDFAKHWGVLAVDRNNRPGRQGTGGVDPIETWRYYARRAKALLNLIASIKQGKIGAIDDWKDLGVTANTPEEFTRVATVAAQYPMPQFLAFPTSLEGAGRALESEVNAWMKVWRQDRYSAPADFQISFVGNRSWEMAIDFHGHLFPALAFQLCLIAVNADSLYCCSGCGYPYMRSREIRRPRPGQGNYCDLCTKLKIPVRRASERYRERRTRRESK